MKLFYKVTFREYKNEQCIVINDGFVVFEDGNLYGYLTFDLLLGKYDNNTNILMLEITDDDEVYHCYSKQIHELELPEKYVLNSQESKRDYGEFNFLERITDQEKQEEIERSYRHVVARYK